MSLVVLNIIDGTYNIPVYVKMEGGVLGGVEEEWIGEPLWPYEAWMGVIPDNKCDFQGFPGPVNLHVHPETRYARN